MITLNEQEVQNLVNFVNDMPTKYGLPLINFINSKLAQKDQPQPTNDDDKNELDANERNN